jgi:serine/threonine-protein kinase
MDLPRKLGPYRLLRRLGSGGMAEVFLAQAFGASGFEKHVALKVLLPEHQGDGTYERMLIDEARLGSSLAHPNLVGVHDLGIDRGAYYMRLDWVDGGDLGALLGGWC